jgi:hypothetical protein
MDQWGPTAQVEERIISALISYDAGNHKSLRAAASEYNVPYSRLNARYHNCLSKVGQPPSNRCLNPKQEAALQLYIHCCDEIGYSAMPHMIHNAATYILKSSNLNPSVPIRPLGRDWVTYFLAANPDIEKVKQKPKDKKRIDAQKREDIVQYFEKFKKVIVDKGILPSDCWNFDKTGFRIGCGGNQIVITLGARHRPNKDRKSFTIASETNRDYLTSVEAISAAGDVIPPMLILKATQHLFHWYTHTHIPDDYFLGVSETEYSNDELALDWIQHFNQYSARSQRGAWRLLIFDGFGSHLTKQFIDYCDINNIIPFSLPSHTSHILQPLDKRYFSHLNTGINERLRLRYATDASTLIKLNFYTKFNLFGRGHLKKGLSFQLGRKVDIFHLILK